MPQDQRDSTSNVPLRARFRTLSALPLAVAGSLMLLPGCRASEARFSQDAAKPAEAPPVETSAEAPKPAPTDAAAKPQESTPSPPTAAAPGPSSIPAFTGAIAEKKWAFEVTPYLWLAGIQGSVTANNVGIPVQQSFSDLTDNLDFGGSLRAEARKKSWGVLLDTTYIDLSAEVATPGGTGNLGLDTLFMELDLGYFPESAPGLCFLVGARALSLDQSFTAPNLSERDASDTLIDPIIGARGTWGLGKHFLFSLRGDIGGFGVSSELTTQLNGYFRWAFSKVGGIDLGYRMYTYLVDESDANFDLTFGGPTLGVDFRF